MFDLYRRAINSNTIRILTRYSHVQTNTKSVQCLCINTKHNKVCIQGSCRDFYLGSCIPNLKLTILAILELLTFNAQKIKGHVTLTTPAFREFFSGVMSGLYLGSCAPNSKFAALAILELLAFNAQKIKGNVTLTTPPFREFFFRGRVGTLPGIMRAKF